MRRIDNIVVHCTATPHNTTITSIRNHWRNVLGWRNPGYHCLIEADGMINWIHPVSQISNGVGGHNANSVHVAYIGGQKRDNRTQAQKISLINVLMHFRTLFPNARILGHRDFLTRGTPQWKDCPQFDAIEEYKHI